MNVPVCVNNVGHSFWKISIDNGTTGSTNAGNNDRLGHYPKPSIDPETNAEVPARIRLLIAQSGQICDDNSHSFTSSASFAINVNDAISALSEAQTLKNNQNLKYHVLNTLARNCTGQCVVISNNFAKCNAPDGKGITGVRVFDVGDTAWSIHIPLVQFCNPYHHAEQIDNIP
ncbi:MAG: hypothetical protein LBJ67_00140 [Planctomycetaceae bacterium]|nr:hypothetical protein [Planctomycetaceae bacterium]